VVRSIPTNLASRSSLYEFLNTHDTEHKTEDGKHANPSLKNAILGSILNMLLQRAAVGVGNHQTIENLIMLDDFSTNDSLDD